MKAKFGSIIVAGSGKIGGHVVSKNRGGAYLRTKVTPSNPNTAAQANARAILSSLSTQWSLLTDAQRQSFNDAVASFATTDIFGDIKNPSGINLFVKLNANLLQSGQAILSVAPAKEEIPFASLTAAIIDVSDEEIALSVDIATYSGIQMKIQATPAVSNGVSNVKSLLRNIGYIAGVSNSGAIYTAYVAKFGIPTPGSKIGLTIAPILPTGQQGTAQFVWATVQA